MNFSFQREVDLNGRKSISRSLVRRLLLMLVFVAATPIPGRAANITVAWDRVPETSAAGYVVSMRTSANNTPQTFDVGNQTTYTHANAQAGVTYYFAVAAYAGGGETGPWSSEVSAAVPSGPPWSFTNGSFEQGSTGWTSSGSLALVSGGFWMASNGAYAVAFNTGQQPPSGTLSQTFATIAGRTYAVSFDVGAISSVNRNRQRMALTVTGQNAERLASLTASVRAPGNGTRYAPHTLTFVADGPTATVVFQDVSPTSMNVDLMLDNVNVVAR